MHGHETRSGAGARTNLRSAVTLSHASMASPFSSPVSAPSSSVSASPPPPAVATPAEGGPSRRSRSRSRSRERTPSAPARVHSIGGPQGARDGRTRVRPYTITLHDPTPERSSSLEELLSDGRFELVIVGRETCPTTDREHLQGYFKLKNAATWQNVKALFSRSGLDDVHLEQARGSPSQNWQYCSKEGNIFMEKGQPPKGQGQRSDLEAAAAIVAERGLTALAHEMPRQFVLHHRGFAALQQRLIQPRTEAPKVYVLWGPTGTGKSYWARRLTDDPFVWHPQQAQWFDGYEGQDHAIFEEFRGQIPFGMVLSLLDRYDCRVQSKGACGQFRPRKIFFTSPAPPEEWWELLAGNDGKLDQLKRRITRTFHLTRPFNPDEPLSEEFNQLLNL